MKLDSEVLCSLNSYVLYRKPEVSILIEEEGIQISIVRNRVHTFEPDIVLRAKDASVAPVQTRRIRAKLSRLPNMDLRMRVDEWIEKGAYEKWIGNVSVVLTSDAYFELRFVKSVNASSHISGYLTYGRKPSNLELYEWKRQKRERMISRFVTREEGEYEQWINDLLAFLSDCLYRARAGFFDL